KAARQRAIRLLATLYGLILGTLSRPSLVDLAQRKSRLARVALHDRFALGMAQHAVDEFEAGRGAFLHLVDHPLRSALAIEAHDLGGLGQAVELVFVQRLHRVVGLFEERASRIACAVPLEPTGYMGCAASPSSVTRPKLQCGRGSRSHIGYSQHTGVARTKASTSTPGTLKRLA